MSQCITLVVGAVRWWGISKTDDALKEAVEVHLRASETLAELNETQKTILGAERVLVYEKDAELTKRQYEDLEVAGNRSRKVGKNSILAQRSGRRKALERFDRQMWKNGRNHIRKFSLW